MFHFGVVLFNTPPKDILRLCKSIEAACAEAQVAFTLTFLRNSDEALSLPDEVTNLSRFIAFTSNVGFGGGHNEIVSSLGDTDGFYIGLNPDGFLSPWAMSAATARSLDARNIYEFQQHPQEHPKEFDPISGCTAWSSGAAFLIDLNLFRALGGFDTSFFMYCEDVDLSWRVRESGGDCVMMAGSLFCHDVSDERQSPEIVVRMLSSQILLAQKWGASKTAKDIEKRLREFERKHSLPATEVPDSATFEPRSVTPEFCDFSRQGSYSVTRW